VYFFFDVPVQLLIVTGTRQRAVMPYVIAEPCIGVKGTACISACPAETTDSAATPSLKAWRFR
jgi:hypothetical protein